MKHIAPLITWLIILSLFPTEAFGRVTSRQADRGAAVRNVPRSPTTGSHMSRPQQRPATRPSVQRPSAPANRPSVQRPSAPATRPSIQRPTPPATRPSIQRPTPPATRPSIQRPATPTTRPSIQRPAERPGNRPVPGPGNRPEIRPENRPSLRPTERPQTRPGDVSFPRPGRPGEGAVTRPGNINRPAIGRPGEIMRPDNTRPGIGNRPDTGINNRPGNRPDRPGWGNEWGNWGDWNRPGNRPGGGPWFSNNNINISNNSRNWSYRPSYWGSRPWWSARHHHHWHHGCWNYGWSSSHRRNSFARGFFWGVTAWGLGNLIFNSGYQVFVNPFPAPPVINNAGTTIINYTQPITVAAAEFPPGDEATQAASDAKADLAMDEALAAFRKGDYPAALTAVDRALSVVPGDPAMHEFRALVFFAMGRFNDAAGVLNPVLASGPGWDWTTMTGLFESQEIYAGHLRKLEAHHDANPDSAAANFVLGYHYLVLGHLEESYKLFSRSAALEPTDVVSASLRDLLRDSINSSPQDDPEAPATIPVAPEKIVGNWISNRPDEGKITLVLKEDGGFSWSFDKTGKAGEIAGEFAIEEGNLLVLNSPDSQLVGKVSFMDDSKMSFILADGPRGDTGLVFDRQQ